ARSVNFAESSGRLGARSRSGAAEESRSTANAANRPDSGGAASGVLSANGAAARLYFRWRGDNALGRAKCPAKSSGRASRIRNFNTDGAFTLFPAADHSFALYAVSLRSAGHGRC